jgi:organic hydroperoxide reductase OsmC/OhrA
VHLPYPDANAVDPEEIFLASRSSCHMLWFLSIAAKHGFVLDRYHDTAEGVMEQDFRGKLMMSVVKLRPEVTFSGDNQPTTNELAQFHHEAHGECFIAKSVKTEVRCEPVDLVILRTFNPPGLIPRVGLGQANGCEPTTANRITPVCPLQRLCGPSGR